MFVIFRYLVYFNLLASIDHIDIIAYTWSINQH